MADPTSSTRPVGGDGRPIQVMVEVVEGPEKGATAKPDQGGVLLVGRASEAQLRVESDRHISRHHFLIELRQPTCFVVDLGSANGTLHRGQRVEGQSELGDGDLLEAGSSTFKVHIRPIGPAPRARPRHAEAQDDDRQKRIRCRVCQRLVVFERATVLVDDAGHVVSQAGPDSDFVCKECRGDQQDVPDAQFPGYKTLEQIGEGSMGSVYLVEGLTSGELYALKRMRPDAPLKSPDVQRFLREAASLSALRHRNIVGFVDQGYVDGDFFFVMEYVEGVDLDLYRRQAGGRVPIDRCVGLVSQVLDGLDYAHRQGFVHRDVKPANILVGVQDGQMTPKLTDFGLAKRTQDSTITRGHISFGTPDYMAPEQITHFRDIGARGDIYAMGATLYHLLTGYTLYDGISGPDPIRTLLEVDPMPVKKRAPFLPAPIAEVIERALRRKPEERWPTAAVFRDGLLQAMRLS